MKKSVMISTILSLLLLGFNSVKAEVTKQSVIKGAIKNEMLKAKKAPKEIISGMQNTFKALKALQIKNKEEAIKYLEAADKSFNTALKANPELDLVPIDERVQAAIFMGDSKKIAKIITDSIKLLKAHNTQVAIDLLSTLKDEIDISIINIPMKIYPLAVKKALSLTKAGKLQEAIATVATAMNSLVVINGVIPLPLLTAQALVVDASKLDKNKKKEVLVLLEAAKEELKRAELLGYTNKYAPDYKALNESINAIEKEIKGKNIVEKLYDKLINDFKALIIKTREGSLKDSVAKKEAQALKNPKMMNGDLKVKQKLEQLQKKDEIQALKEKKIFKKESTIEEKKSVVK